MYNIEDIKNTVICADCLTIMKQLPDKCVDLVLTDPPYGVNLEYDKYDDSPENWYSLMNLVIPEIRRIAKFVVFPSCQIKRIGWYYKNHEPDWLLCWHKGSTGCSSTIGFNDWEPHIVYGKPNKMMHDFFAVNNNEKMGNYGHPCPKPVGWAEWIIQKSTDENQIVLDCFLGSGTTAVACKRTGRDFIGIEISPEYCEIARQRIIQAETGVSVKEQRAGQKALFS